MTNNSLISESNGSHNFYIKNNFYEDFELDDIISYGKNKKSSLNARDQNSFSFKEKDQEKILRGLIKNVEKLNESKGKRKITNYMNFLILIIAVILLSFTIYIQSNNSDNFISEQNEM